MKLTVLAYVALAPWMIATTVAQAPGVTSGSQTYYVPMPEKDTFDKTFKKISGDASGDINTIIAISISLENTQITYDHWEDGYGSGASTRIWGDGIAANGCAPSVSTCTDATDVLLAGTSIVLENAVPQWHRSNPVGLYFDGGDKITSSRPIAMTRGSYPDSPGSLMAGGVEMFPTTAWGKEFRSPVSSDSGSASSFSEHASLYIMAMEASTTIKTPSGTTLATLNQGQTYVRETLGMGERIIASKPVQVHLITGDIGSTYELRWFALHPTEKWSKEYWSPVGDSTAATKVLMYNPGTSSISVSLEYYKVSGTDTPSEGATLNSGTTTTAFSVPSNAYVFTPVIPSGSGARVFSSSVFLPLSISDTGSGGTSGMIYDWGFPLIPTEMLTPRVLVGWGYGCTTPKGTNACNDKTSPDTNKNKQARSPVWVAPVADADICVDWNGNGTFQKMSNRKRLQSIPLRKTVAPDFDMSGSQIKAVKVGQDCSNVESETVNIVAAWGQKGAWSYSGDDEALDLGTLIPPFSGILAGEIRYYNPAIKITKFAGNQGSCSVGSVTGTLFDVTYASTDPFFQYCYKIQVTSNDECVDGISIKDTGVGGFGQDPVLLSDAFSINEPLCFGQELIIPGPNPSQTLTSISSVASVEGFGVMSAKKVTSTDGAGVTVPGWIPQIGIKKYAAYPGGCSLPVQTTKMFDDTFSSPDGKFQYCYVISVPSTSQECVSNLKLYDNGNGGLGGADVTVPGTICPNGTPILFTGPPDVTTRLSISSQGKVTGTGVWSNTTKIATDPAGVTVNWTPAISIIKYAGPPNGKCKSPFDSASFVDGAYLSPDGTFQYCYLIQVPQTSQECVVGMKLKDTGIGGLGTTDINVVGTLCPGGTPIVVAGPANVTTRVSISSTATVTGTGQDSTKPVNATDPESVTVDFIPKISVKKYAGAPGSSCSNPFNPSLFDDATFFAADGQFKYCYVISVPADSQECLNNLKLIDPATGGIGASLSVSGSICKGGTPIVVSGPVTTTRASIESTVTVNGKGVDSGKPASASDPAGVRVDFVPAVSVTKYAAPASSSCSSEAGLADVTYASPDGSFRYCYFIRVPESSKECVTNIKLSDTAGGGFGIAPINVAGTLCFGNPPIAVPGPPSSTRINISSPATVTATGVDSGKNVTAVDPAGVSVDFTPKIVLKKYASAPDGSCSVPLDVSKLEDETYFTLDGSFQYCYVIRLAPDSQECVANFKLTDTGLGGAGSSITVGETLCVDSLPLVYAGPSNVEIDEGAIESIATVTGKGIDSGKTVSSSDGAGVEMLGCPTGGDMTSTGSTFCPAPIEGVVRVSVIGAEEKDTDIDMIYAIQPAGAQGSTAVQFKVTSPFVPVDTNMFVQYHGPTGKGGWTYQCDEVSTSGCVVEMEPIVADCLEADGNAFTMVHVYFLPATAAIPPSFVGVGTDVHECCHAPANTPPASAVQYTFLLRCSCPETSRRLGKASAGSDDGKIDVENVLAAMKNW